MDIGHPYNLPCGPSMTDYLEAYQKPSETVMAFLLIDFFFRNFVLGTIQVLRHHVFLLF